MFSLRKRTQWKSGQVLAPMTGVAVPLSAVPDDIVQQGLLGDGVAILPENGAVYAPFPGTVTLVANSKHAFCLRSKDGMELLIHIGIDTVELGGRGFHSKVSTGSVVTTGQLLCQVDLDVIRQAELPLHTLVLSTNFPVEKKLGSVIQGKTIILNHQSEEENH